MLKRFVYSFIFKDKLLFLNKGILFIINNNFNNDMAYLNTKLIRVKSNNLQSVRQVLKHKQISNLEVSPELLISHVKLLQEYRRDDAHFSEF